MKHIFLIMTLFFNVIHCMNEMSKSDEQSKVKQVILRHGFSFTDRCKLALVDKNWNKAVENYALQKQTHLKKFIQKDNKDISEDQLVWHQSGLYTWIEKHKNPKNRYDANSFEFCICSFHDDNSHYLHKKNTYPCSASSLEGVCPFFDKDGISFYGYYDWRGDEGVTKYTRFYMNDNIVCIKDVLRIILFI